MGSIRGKESSAGSPQSGQSPKQSSEHGSDGLRHRGTKAESASSSSFDSHDELRRGGTREKRHTSSEEYHEMALIPPRTTSRSFPDPLPLRRQANRPKNQENSDSVSSPSGHLSIPIETSVQGQIDQEPSTSVSPIFTPTTFFLEIAAKCSPDQAVTIVEILDKSLDLVDGMAELSAARYAFCSVILVPIIVGAGAGITIGFSTKTEQAASGGLTLASALFGAATGRVQAQSVTKKYRDYSSKAVAAEIDKNKTILDNFFDTFFAEFQEAWPESQHQNLQNFAKTEMSFDNFFALKYQTQIKIRNNFAIKNTQAIRLRSEESLDQWKVFCKVFI